MLNLTEADLIACAKLAGVIAGIVGVYVWVSITKHSAGWKNLTDKAAKEVQESMHNANNLPDLHEGASFTEYRAYGKRWMGVSMSDWSNHWSKNLTFPEFKQALVNANAPALPNIQASRNLDMFIEGAWAEYTRRVDRR